MIMKNTLWYSNQIAKLSSKICFFSWIDLKEASKEGLQKRVGDGVDHSINIWEKFDASVNFFGRSKRNFGCVDRGLNSPYCCSYIICQDVVWESKENISQLFGLFKNLDIITEASQHHLNPSCSLNNLHHSNLWLHSPKCFSTPMKINQIHWKLNLLSLNSSHCLQILGCNLVTFSSR